MAHKEIGFYTISQSPVILLFYLVLRIAQTTDKAMHSETTMLARPEK